MLKPSKKRIILISAIALLLVGSAAAYFGGSWYLQRRAATWKREGIAASRAGDDAKASELLLRFLRRHPSDTEALTYYVTSRERAPMADGQQFAETIAALKLLIQQRPNNIDDHLHLLELYVRLERGPEALDAANAILVKAPANIRTLQLKTQLLTEMGRYREGLETADRWVAVAPDQLAAQMARLSLHVHLEHPAADIIADATKMRESHPGNADFEVLQGFAYAHTGDDDQARHWLKTAAAHPDLSPETAKLLVEQLDGAGMSADALTVLGDLVQRGGNDDLRHTLAQRLWELMQWKATVDTLQPLAPADPKADTNLLAFKCISLVNLKRTDEANLYRKAISDRRDPGARAWALLLQRMLDGTEVDDQKIVAACQTAISIDPLNSYLTFYLGEADVRRGELDLAIDAFRRAAAMNTSWNLPAVQLVDCLLQKGKPEQAVDVATYCARRHPNDAASVITLARAWASGIQSGGVGQPDDLLKLVNEVQKQLPGEDRTLLIQMQLLAGQKKTEEARNVGQTAIRRTPPPGEDIFRIVALLNRKYALGLEPECYTQWESALGVTPALAYSRAVDEFSSGRGEAGLSVFDDCAAKSGKSAQMGWQIARARYLDLTKNPEAKPAWIALRDKYPNQMIVQEQAVNVRAGQGDWQYMQPVIDNLHKLSGEDGLAWRLASASLMIQSPRSEDDYEKGSVELNKLIQRYPNLVEPHVLLARALVHMKRNDGAIEQLTVASKIEPTSVPIALQLSALLQSQGDFERVEQELDRITPELHTREQRQQAAILLSQQNNPDRAIQVLQGNAQPGSTTAPVASAGDSAALDGNENLLLARLYRQRHEIAKSDSLTRKLMEHPDLPTIQFATSLFLSEGLNTDAESALHRLDELKLAPGLKDLAWGWYYSHIGDLKNAAVSFSKATTEAPNDAAGWRELAMIQMCSHQSQSAMQTVNQACDAIPGNADFTKLKDNSKLLTEAGDDGRLSAIAIDVLRNPSTSAPLLELLQASLDEHRSHDMEHYAATLQNLCERHPENITCQIQLVQCYLDMGRTDQAMNGAQRLMSAFAKDPEPARVAVMVSKSTGRWREMESAAQTWKERQPEAAEAADCAMAHADLQLQNSSTALERLQPYISKAASDPDRHVEVLTTYALASAATGDNSTAGNTLWPLAVKSARWRRLWISVALQLSDGAVASDWLDKASGIIPAEALPERIGLAEAYDRLGRRLNDQKLIDRATQLCNAAGKDPNADATALLAAGAQSERSARLGDAESFYRHALQLNPSIWVAKNNLAMIILNRGGDLTEAEQFARDATTLHPQDPELLDTLAAVRAKAGKMQDAAECMRTAAKLQPGNPLWRIRLGEYLLSDGNRAGASQAVAEIDADFPELHRWAEKPTKMQEELELLRRSIAGKAG